MQRNTGYFPTESLEPSINRLFSRSALNEGYLFRGSLVFVLAVPAFALEPETQVIDLGTVDLGNGVSYHTVLTIENSALRASVKKGSITRDFSYYGAAIGSVQLNGIFSYDGHTATATSASVYHTVSNGWSYGGESSWCSGNTANMSATFSKGSASVPVSATLSCSPTGALS